MLLRIVTCYTARHIISLLQRQPSFETVCIENRGTLYRLEDFKEAMLQQLGFDGLTPRSVIGTPTTNSDCGEYRRGWIDGQLFHQRRLELQESCRLNRLLSAP